MKTKHIFFPFLLLILGSMLGSIVSAGMMPLIVYGTASYNGVEYPYAEITVSDTRGNEWSVFTSNSGVFTFDVGNFQRTDNSYVEAGDVLTLSICPEVGCKTEITITENPLEASFGVVTQNCPIIVCPICPAVASCEIANCDEQVVGGVAAIIGFLTGVAGIYFFKRKDALLPNGTYVKFGGAGPLHYHRGLRGYHDPNTSHRDIKERHPKGMLDPSYVKNEDGKWVYQE